MEILDPPPPYDDKRSGAEGDRICEMEEGDLRIAYWEEKNVRQAFIRKVYSIITLQLLLTVAIVAIFTFVTPVNTYVINHIPIYYTSYAVFLICYLVLVFCQKIQRRYPWNIILMTIFTLSLGYMTGTIASMHDTKAVILAMIITTVITITVTAFSFQTKVDLTTWTGFFCILSIVLFVTSITAIIVLTYKYIYWVDMLYSAICAIIFTLFLAYDTQLLLGNKRFFLSPEDYIYGAIQIYVDVIYIFLSILRLGSRR
ncbi:protein lifeguard 3-like [Thamnophis elegans]|uniref:protein lifeguard 3-like n=1 Tax=Thamnophis elegans TaxID=35005 RepID=UPI001376DC79|nr:protein lifeguard 3-like [Thamnophis elegans]XP_032091310.1 protein lifeguard 3-like [Thamnophis elegans]